MDIDMSARGSLGLEIRQLRAAAGITLAELSGRSGVREPYLAAIEADLEEPSAAALRRLVLALEPAGTSYDRIAGLLPPRVSGEYAGNGGAPVASPAHRAGDPEVHEQQTSGPDGFAARADAVWRG